MDPITIALLAGGVGGVWWLRKNHPDKLPKFLQPKGTAAAGGTVAKAAAVKNAVAASTPTPHPSAGLDPGMTTAQVDAANQLLAAGTDSNAMYTMASDYSAQNFVKTAAALIAKADAVAHAKTQGASDSELFNQMMSATSGSQMQSTAAQAVASATPGAAVPGVDFSSLT